MDIERCVQSHAQSVVDIRAAQVRRVDQSGASRTKLEEEGVTGRATAARSTVSASKSYAPHHEYIFSPRVFTELQNGQAIALPYDGLNPMPPQFCYLKPHYLDVQTSYFDQVARGQL